MRPKLTAKKSLSTQMDSTPIKSTDDDFQHSKSSNESIETTKRNKAKKHRKSRSTPRKSVLSESNSRPSERKITLRIRRDVKMVDVGVGDYAMVGTMDRGVGDGIIDPDWLPKFPVSVFNEESNSESSGEEWGGLKFPRKSASKENSKPKKPKSKQKAAKTRPVRHPKSVKEPKIQKRKLKQDERLAGKVPKPAEPQKKSVPAEELEGDPSEEFPEMKKRMRFDPKVNCEICGRLYPKRYMSYHRQTHKKEKPHNCEKCGKNFAALHYYKEHVKQCVENPAAFQCEICHRNLATKNSLDVHLQTHSNDFQFQCHICPKSFKQQSNLNNHIKTHSDQRPFSCDVCGKTYRYKKTVEKHKAKVHEGIKIRFPCDRCDRTFICKTRLKDHIDHHLGISRHKCEHCGKRFEARKVLLNHLLIHLDKKPFPCDVCGKQFRQRQELKRHMTTHTGIKPFRCDDCGKQFIHRVYLVRHKCPKHTQPESKQEHVEVPVEREQMQLLHEPATSANLYHDNLVNPLMLDPFLHPILLS